VLSDVEMSAKTENWTCKCSRSGSSEFVESGEEEDKRNSLFMMRCALGRFFMSLYTASSILSVHLHHFPLLLLPAESSI
jgi:hypothetical protein